MTRRIVRLVVLGGLAAAAGCASRTGTPRLVPGSNITLPTQSDVIRDLLLGCNDGPSEVEASRRANCGSVIGGTRAVPAAPVPPPDNRTP